MYCAMHFIVGHWPGELLLLVWNNWAPFGVPLFQSVSEFSIGSGAGGGLWAGGGCICSQFLSKVCCAAMDLADACQYWFLVALIDVSHCHLSLWGRFSVCLIVSLKSTFEALGSPFLPMLYCSWMFALTSRSFIQFGYCQCNSLFWWSHCCLVFFNTHFSTSKIHFSLKHLSCWLL